MAGEGLDVGTLTGRIELEDRLTNVLGQIGGSIGKFEEGFKEAGSTVLQQAASFFTAEAALHAVEEAIHLGIDTIKELTLEGAAVADVEENFNHLMETSGRLGSTLLGALKDGTHNTITDFELMKAANSALALGVDITDKQYRQLADGAFALAQAKGIDVAHAFEVIDQAMIRGQARGLRQLDLTVDSTKAEEAYAAKLKVRVETLTEEEKVQATREAILTAVGDATKRLGEQSDGLDEKIAQVQTTWKNFEEELGKTVATSPVLLTAFDAIREELMAAFGGNSESLVKGIATAIDNAAISAIDFAKVVVDGVAIAGVEWNAFKVVLETSEQGFRAITYVVEEVLLGMMKVANFVSGGSLFGDAIKSTEEDIDRLYNAMAEGQNKIAGYKQAEDDWAISTGHVKEALDRVQQKMIDAQKTAAEHAATQKEGAAAAEAHAGATDKLDAATGKLGATTRLTKEEQKALAEALKEMDSAGKSWETTLTTISGDTVEAVKYYLEAGVALDKLSLAYGLTQTQAKAIEQAWKAGNLEIAAQTKALDMLTDLWGKYFEEVEALGATDSDKIEAKAEKDYEAAVTKLQALGDKEKSHYEQLWDLRTKDIANEDQKRLESDTKSKASLDQRLSQARDTYQFMMRHSDQYTSTDIDNQRKIVASLSDMREHWGEINSVIDKQTEMVRTLSGEVITLKEYEARQSQGGSTNINVGNFAQNAAGFGLNVSAAEAMARKGYSFQQIVEILRANPGINVGSLPPGQGPRIPGFRDGGVGDFGDGTLAVLHGKEAIVPLDGHAGIGGIELNFYVNGTAVQAAQQIKDIILRELHTRKQL